MEFHIGHGDMIRLLRSCGFEVKDLIEIRPCQVPPTRHGLPPSNGRGNGPARKSGKPGDHTALDCCREQRQPEVWPNALTIPPGEVPPLGWLATGGVPAIAA